MHNPYKNEKRQRGARSGRHLYCGGAIVGVRGEAVRRRGGIPRRQCDIGEDDVHQSRREFLSGAAAFGLGGWRLFAAPSGWKHGGKPNLVFGVLSDTHFRTDSFWRRGIKSDKYFVAALECFRDMNVDAVVFPVYGLRLWRIWYICDVQ